jgi:hypothetical protein
MTLHIVPFREWHVTPDPGYEQASPSAVTSGDSHRILLDVNTPHTQSATAY